MSDFDEQLKNFDEEKFKEVAKRHGLEVTFHSDRAGFYNAATDTFTPIDEAEEDFFNYIQGKPDKKKSDKSTLSLIIKTVHRLMGKIKRIGKKYDLTVLLIPLFLVLVLLDFVAFGATICALFTFKLLTALVLLIATTVLFGLVVWIWEEMFD